MSIKPIKTKENYVSALKRLEEVFDAPQGTSESDEADVLADLIDAYEEKHYPVDAPDPITAIQIRMEEMQLRQVDVAEAFGGKNRVSEILNRKRKLTVEMIRNITKRLHISPRVLIRDYNLSE